MITPIFGVGTAGRDDFVQAIGAEPGEHGVALEILQALLLIEDRVARANIEAAGRHDETGWNDRPHAIERDVDRARRFNRILQTFETGPGAGETAHRIAVKPVIDDLLHASRRQDRHHHIDEVELGLMRGRRGFGGVIVAHEGKYAAIFRGAREIGVAEDIAAAIDARTLAVPEREDAVVLALPAHLGLLRAPYGGRGEILVEARLKQDAGGIERALGAQEIQGRDRRAASRDSPR